MAQESNPLVIAHRGASGYLPEHTLPAYAFAYAQGADFIEPDLVMTKDGRFICLHDIHLERTTNVAELYEDRAREDGRYYAADFTLAEIKTLRAVERLPNRFPKASSRFEVPTFDEMIELVQGLNQSTGRRVGIYPELKSPDFHRNEGLPMEQPFLDLVRSYGYRGPEAPIFVQCFEEPPLQRMRELGSRLPQVFLISDAPGVADSLTAERLREVAAFADGIGPAKTLIETDPELVRRSHAAGLVVHPYTFRADSVPKGYPNFEAELQRFLVELGVDGLFTDFPDQALAVRRAAR